MEHVREKFLIILSSNVDERGRRTAIVYRVSSLLNVVTICWRHSRGTIVVRFNHYVYIYTSESSYAGDFFENPQFRSRRILKMISTESGALSKVLSH